MKALVCFWGILRAEINPVIDNYIAMFPDYQLDFMISTWEDQNLDESKYVKTIKTPQPSLEYLDEIKFPSTSQIVHDQLRSKYAIGQYSQFFHNFKIFQFLSSLTENYDLLIKSRTDLLFQTDYQFDFSQDLCYIPTNCYCGGGFITDHFIGGKFDYVKKALSMSNFEDFFPVVEQSFNPEEANLKLITNNGCEIFNFPVSFYMILPDRRFL